MGATELSAMLWRERELLELLTFKLEEEQLILMSGKTRWLQHATREVEQVLERVREAGLGRSVEVAALAREWGTDENAALRELIARAPSGPWAEIFTSHLNAMSALTTQIKDLRDTNEQFLRAAMRSTQETLAGLDNDTSTYDARGESDLVSAGARLFDQSL
jgi:hypothetical protein